MADVKACLMAFVYLAGTWSWIARKTADLEGLPCEPCVLDLGHAGSCKAGIRVVAAQYAIRDHLRSTPNPERDQRRAAYGALRREQARKALDDWFRAVDADGSRWKEWEAFIESTAAYAAYELQQKSHYGVADDRAPYPHPFVAGDDVLCIGCGGLESDARHHNRGVECGCKVGCTTVCYCDGAGRHVHGGNCPPLAVSEDEAQRSDIRISGRP